MADDATGSGPMGQWLALPAGAMALVHEFTTPANGVRGRATFQIQNAGPGDLVDFRVSVAANDHRECPWTPYLGAENTTSDADGDLDNSNVLFTYPASWPTIPPNVGAGMDDSDPEDPTGAAVLTCFHQYYSRLRLYLKAGPGGAVVRVFAQG